VGTIFQWRKEITDYANLKEVNRRLAEENADWRNRHISSYTPVEDLFVRIQDTIRRQEYRVITAKVVNSTWHKPKNYLTLDKGAKAGVHGGHGSDRPRWHRGRGARWKSSLRLGDQRAQPGHQAQCAGPPNRPLRLLYWDTNDPRTASVIDIAKHARVAVGDTVETRGGDRIFPAGCIVGVVER
jgi:rod shape-determining protein MreC